MNTRIQMATPTRNFERARKRRLRPVQTPTQTTPGNESRLMYLLGALAVACMLALAVSL